MSSGTSNVNNTESAECGTQGESVKALANAVVANFQQQGINSQHIGLMIDMSEDSIGGFGFADTDNGNEHWFINDFESYEAIESLWEQMNKSWDSALLIADLEADFYNLDFLTEQDMQSWRQSENDYDGVLAHYKVRQKELVIQATSLSRQ